MVKKLTMFLAALLLTAVGAMAQTQVKGTVVSQEDGLPSWVPPYKLWALAKAQ